jgi:LPS export ABC transporter protein LptC/lipopolysaccharide transport protein LptA
MRNRILQIALSLAFLVLLIQIVLIAPSQIRDKDEAAILPVATQGSPAKLLEPASGGENGVDQSMKGMHMTETEEGAKDWELWADRAISMKAKDLLELEKVKTIFFSDNGVTFTVTGKKGQVFAKEKNLWVEGNVITRSSNGYVFRTERVAYDSKARQLHAPGHVEMLGPKDGDGLSLKLTGIGMNASLERSSMEVLRDVKAEKMLDKGRKAFIRSHRARFSGKDRTAIFQGDVILDMDSMRITGPAAEFEWDGKAQAVKTVNFSGGARVSDADKWATAENVRVDFEKNRFVFRGNPRVVQNNDELRGEEIVFFDGGKRVQVRRARAKMDEKRLERTN